MKEEMWKGGMIKGLKLTLTEDFLHQLSVALFKLLSFNETKLMIKYYWEIKLSGWKNQMISCKPRLLHKAEKSFNDTDLLTRVIFIWDCMLHHIYFLAENIAQTKAFDRDLQEKFCNSR